MDPDPTWFQKGSYWLINCKGERKSAARPYLVPIWHVDPRIQMQKYVWTRILHGIWKAVVDLQIVKVKVNLLPDPTWFLFCIWIQEFKCKNMFGPGSYMVSERQLLTYKLYRWKKICYPALPGSYFAFGSRNKNAKICLDPDPTWFKKGSYWLINCKGEGKSAARPYLVPIWHVDPRIKM